MELARHKTKWLWVVLVAWLVFSSSIILSQRVNALAMTAVDELNHNIDTLRRTLYFTPPFRSQNIGKIELDLQLMRSLRLQLEATYSTNFFTPDITSILYSVDRFYEQVSVYIETEVAIEDLIKTIDDKRLNNQFDSNLSNRYSLLSAYVLKALYSDSEVSPEVYRGIDSLFLGSESLSESSREELQQLLSHTALVLGSYAKGRYVVGGLVDNIVHDKMALFKHSYYDTANTRIAILFVGNVMVLFVFVFIFRLPARKITTDDKKQVEIKAGAPEDRVNNFAQVEPIDNTLVTSEKIVSNVIDIERMLDALSGDKESVELLLEVFIQDHALDVTHLRDQIDTDHELALRTAHSLKGVGGSLGSDQIKESAAVIELALKQRSFVDKQALDRLERVLSMAVDEAKLYLQTSKV